MLFKIKITKYRFVIIAIAAVIFFALSLYYFKKTTNSVSSTDKYAKVNASDPTVNDSKDNSTIKANAEVTQAIAVRADLNNYVLKVIPSYETGKYPYLLNTDYDHYNGVTQNIIYQGSIIAKADPDGSRSSHCVGLTYEVFFKAMQERNKEADISSDNFNNMTINNMKDFMLTWYNAEGTPKSKGDQLAGAIVKYGLGTQIKRLEDAKGGDFIDFSRTKSGHTAVFIDWIRNDKGNIVGFKYWSTQESTHGIAYKVEYFSDNTESAFKGSVNRNELYIGRIGPISNYQAF